MTRPSTTLPPADPWQRIAPGLRARRLEGGGVEVQTVRNVEGVAEPVSTPSLTLEAAAVVELALFASAYHDEGAATRALARVHLVRFLAGKDAPR